MPAEDGVTLLWKRRFWRICYTEPSTSLYEVMVVRLIYMPAKPVCILYQNRHNAMPQTHRNTIPFPAFRYVKESTPRRE